MSALSQRDCIACRGGVPPLTAEQIAPLLVQIEPGWSVVERVNAKGATVTLLSRRFPCEAFAGAMRLAVRIGEMAEEQQHHPDLYVAWGALGVEIWTHKIGGLTESDFIFAAKCDALAAV